MEKDHLPSFAGLKFLVLIMVGALTGCPGDSGLPDPDIVQSFVAEGNQVYSLETTGLTEFSFTINLGTTPRDLYFVITNPGTAAAGVPLPVVEAVQGDLSGSVRSVTPETVIPARSLGTESLSGPGRALRDRPGLDVWAPLEPAGTREITMEPRGINALDTLYDTAKDGGTIPPFNAGEDGLIDATCQAVIPGVETAFGPKNLSIWVADDCWQDGGSSKSYSITVDMVNAMAAAFLKTGADNDIYDWITGIFGEEWGDPALTYLIPDNDEITILLYDISHDDDPRFVEGATPPNTPQNGYVAGFFSSKDNYKTSAIPSSNERIMFYIDAVAFALSDELSWAISDPYPQDQISTLAHEFQHMIMFYQKYTLRGAGPKTWLNEMSSLMAEDFVSDKLGIPGPRGVDPGLWPAGTAGDSGNDPGRISVFNQYPEESLTDWSDAETGILPDYSAAYSFGAFLGRNYGGAGLFKEIVQSSLTDDDAVISAIKEVALKDVTFPRLLQDWGTAVLLSDQITESAAVTDRRLNRAGWFSEAGYNLGSINHYYYGAPPYYYFPDNLSAEYETWYNSTNQQPASNIYVLAASSATGIVEHNFTVGEGVRVTAVVKEASP